MLLGKPPTSREVRKASATADKWMLCDSADWSEESKIEGQRRLGWGVRCGAGWSAGWGEV